MVTILHQIFLLYSEHGSMLYVGEPITQTEHAIQCALAAKRNKARSALVAACLLHDIGHLLDINGSVALNHNTNLHHEMLAAQFLSKYFNQDVIELIKHHVNAKRYLTSIDHSYYKRLSSASIKSLKLQGGPMSQVEVKAFAIHPLLKEILLLRKWDEAAKVPNRRLPCITEFLPELRASLM